jgi:hypothetical protein
LVVGVGEGVCWARQHGGGKPLLLLSDEEAVVVHCSGNEQMVKTRLDDRALFVELVWNAMKQSDDQNDNNTKIVM